jgi:putative oxidoreductase
MAEQRRASTYFVPGLAGVYDSLGQYAVPLVRVAAGLILMPHGAQKLFGMFGAPPREGYIRFFTNLGLEPADAWLIFIGCVEFFGGLMLAVGLLTRLAAAAITIQMFYIAFFINMANGFFWTPKAGIEYPLLWGIVALAFWIMGGGRFSVDRAIGKEL